MEERIMTKHPDPEKAGVNITKAKYDAVRDAIVASIGEHGEITFQSLVGDVSERLAGQFEGSVPWYVTSVKLDLEARGVIARLSGCGLQRLRLVER